MKGHSIFLKASRLEPHHQIQFSVIIRTFIEVGVLFWLGCQRGCFWVGPCLVLPDSSGILDISLYLTNFNLLMDVFEDQAVPLPGGLTGSDLISIKGIVGLDLIHHLGPLQLVPCLWGWVFSVLAGLVPFGKVDSFFHMYWPFYSPWSILSFNAVLERTARRFFLCLFCPGLWPNLCEPPGRILSRCSGGLEWMFSVESFGSPKQRRVFQ